MITRTPRLTALILLVATAWSAPGIGQEIEVRNSADLPAAAFDQPTAVRTYSVPTEQLEHWATAIRQQFADVNSVKVATDARTGRLVVLAPAVVQSQIGIQLQSQVGAGPHVSHRAVASRRNRDTSSQRTIRHQVRLKHLNREQLTRGLESVWGGPLPATQNDDVHTITLMAGQGQTVQISLKQNSRNVSIAGPYAAATSWAQIISALDEPQTGPGRQTRVMPLRYSDRGQVESALAVMQASASSAADVKPAVDRRQGMRWGGDLTAMIFQPAADENIGQPEPDGNAADPVTDGDAAQGDADDAPQGLQDIADDERDGVLGPVQIELLEGLDVVVIRGNKRDVARVEAIIRDIERLSAETEPRIEVLKLEHADGEALQPLVTDLYNQFFAPRHGTVSVNALVKPNSLLIIGRPEAVEAAAELIQRLDQPVEPESQFRVFPLRFLAAQDAAETINEFYEERGGLGTRLRVSADFRSNSLIVQGSPRDLLEISEMLKDLDVGESRSVNELRVFRLKNSLASDLAPVIQAAINGVGTQGLAGTGQNQQGGQADQVRSTMLTLKTIDSTGGRLLKTGILTDVQVNADERANSLIVRAPSEAMSLIAALVEQLDQLPSEAQIKVFTIVNGDAASLAETLDDLFGTQQQGQAGQAFGAGQGDSSLVPLRFSVDLRTNSIITSGSSADLQVVEAILLRLDESDIRERITVVYRLKNSPANDVANAINQFLQGERDVQQLPQGGDGTPFEQIEREVVVVPEPVSNSLIVSASPRYFEEVEEIVEQLDERPPMVMIQVLIAEVLLSDTDEIGVELGIQDSLLFDRSSLAGDLLDPGFNFNNQPLGNANNANSLATRENLAGQALTSFAVGRTNQTLGYGGLVLSAGSESLNVLIRALQDERSAQILSRPQVMTLDNQPAFIQVGARVPRITSSNIVNNAVINNTVLENVGILLGVTPRIAPDGQVVMEIDAEKSELGDEADGIPISINANGDVIRSPQINIITAQTTVSARSGQTVILGGLITKSSTTTTRRVPYLSEVPVLGNLFRYDGVMENRAELLFIMTPYIVRNDDDIEFLKHMESSRMSWCLADVACVHGEHGLSDAYGGDCGPGFGGEGLVIYPDENPTGIIVPADEAIIHSPQGEIQGPIREVVPAPQPNQFDPPTFEVPELPDSDPREFSSEDEGEQVQPAGFFGRRRRSSRYLWPREHQPNRLPEVQP